MTAVLLILGLLGLWGGTLLTIDGAVQVSEEYGISEGVVGLAILAIGTDLPELVVALGGSLQQLRGTPASGVIVGSALGSAIAQATLVLGVAGLVGYLPTGSRTVRRDGLTMLVTIALTGALLADGVLGRLDGAVLLLTYTLYIISLLSTEHRTPPSERPRRGGRFPAPIAIAIGLVTLTLGAHVVVTEGIAMATALGVSQSLVGALFVGIGTSLPELALSVRAAMQKRGKLAVGNIIGSNIFDLLVPLGAGAVIYPLVVEAHTVAFDLTALGLVSLAVLFFLHRRRGVQRGEAIALLVLYAGYGGLRMLLG